jgi:hypothetical protein
MVPSGEFFFCCDPKPREENCKDRKSRTPGEFKNTKGDEEETRDESDIENNMTNGPIVCDLSEKETKNHQEYSHKKYLLRCQQRERFYEKIYQKKHKRPPCTDS